MSDKTLGILLYIDDSPSMLEEFSWIYKSWIHSGNWRTSDLIVCCNPLVYDRLPHEPGVIKIPIEPVAVPGSKWENYRFINSIACLCGPHTEALADRYTHFLRSDADVFLTHHLVNFRPNISVHGRGHYIISADVREKIVDFGARHGLDHQGVFNCGSSLLSGSHNVLAFLRHQYEVCGLLLDEFKDDPGQWPGWCINVITMYAAELVANHHYNQFLNMSYINVLDCESSLWSDIDRTLIIHIHALPTDQYWSKLVHRAGGYKDYDVSNLNIEIVKDYCHWISIASVEDIKRSAGYPS